MKYRGSCHCGNVAYEVEGTIDKALACNCSMCERKGSLLWFVPRAQFRLLTPEDNAKDYLFNKHLIHHRFCTNCGIHPFALAVDPKGNEMAAINIRCIEGIDLDAIPVSHFDGRSR
ncbi:MAG TPA: GFA family protein [Rudaea sp.]